MFNIQKRKLAKILLDNGIKNKTDKIYKCIATIQRINQKLAFSELYNENFIFVKEEVEFIHKLIDIQIFSEKKLMSSLIDETKNNKITDYV